jgi:pimeloyl-ACP methyl ester carboxylesterase
MPLLSMIRLNYIEKLSIVLCFSLLSLVQMVSAQGHSHSDAPRFEEVAKNDSDFPISVPSSYSSLRGYLTVKESKTGNSQQLVSLPLIIIKANTSSNKAPVLRLAGGPGISGLNAAAYPSAYPWTSDRDFIILGQRGTQDAKPALTCPQYANALNVDVNQSDALINAANECKKRYESMGIDLSAYHTMASVEDIEAMRSLFGFEKLSLYGGSYGTRLALSYARQYPDKVSSMVLDSPLPHTVYYDDESPENLKLTIQAFALKCNENQECAKAYPTLYQRFEKTLIEASEQAWEITLSDTETLEVSDTDIVLYLAQIIDNNVLMAPKIMDAFARKDIEQLLAVLGAEGSLISPFAWGMRLSVWCSESAPFSQRFMSRPSATFASLEGATILPEVCKAWGVPSRPLEEKKPTISSIPTLIIAGEFDYLTPPKWGKEAMKTLSNSFLATIPFGVHVESNNWGGDGCAMQIAVSFFQDETSFMLNPDESTTCLTTRESLEFITN